jgi:predicted MarR family transcription regulator
MTEEQLNALENWIVAIIREEDRASGIEDVVYRVRMREAAEVAFGLREKNDG